MGWIDIDRGGGENLISKLVWLNDIEAYRAAGCLTDGLPAFAGRLDGNATGVDDAEITGGFLNLGQAAGFQESGDLFAFVLIHLAAEGLDGKSFHGKVSREVACGGEPRTGLSIL